MHKVYTNDVIEWSEHYDGPLFHGFLSDPPYSLNFMNRSWDDDIAFRPETWRSFKRHMLPGAFGFAFASARGWHRLAVAIEDAGFVIHPTIFLWAFGSGMPKGVRIEDEKFDGYRYGLGALKPAVEPIICFQNPFEGKPIESILKYGAGAVNIDGGRIGYEDGGSLATNPSLRDHINGGNGGNIISHEDERRVVTPNQKGRWPSNLILQHLPECVRVGERSVKDIGFNGGVVSKHPAFFGVDTRNFREKAGYFDENGMETVEEWNCSEDCAVRALDKQSGISVSTGGGGIKTTGSGVYQNHGFKPMDRGEMCGFGDEGGASRYFLNADWSNEVQEQLDNSSAVKYCAKASGKERDAGLSGKNSHVCVKPLKLTEYLAKLLSPPIAYAPRRILVPFSGSGSEMIGAMLAGWEEIVGVESEAVHVEETERRMKFWSKPRAAEVVKTMTKKTATKEEKEPEFEEVSLFD